MTKGFRITIRNGWNGEDKVLNSDIFPNYRLVSAVLSKSTTTYDSFTFDIDPTHAMYTEIEPYTCFVKVTRPDKGLTLLKGGFSRIPTVWIRREQYRRRRSAKDWRVFT